MALGFSTGSSFGSRTIVPDKGLSKTNTPVIFRAEFGDGYDLDDVMNEGIKTLNDAANWMLHEEYSYLCFKGIVPRVSKMMIGFDWEKHDYSLQD